MLFFKKENVKKRVVCPISVIIDIMQAFLNGKLFAQRPESLEIIDADNGTTKFPWYIKLEKYVVE